MKKYDIVLAVTSFRRVMVYLPIIKELVTRYRIGVYSMLISDKEKDKTEETNRLFLNLCNNLGADIIAAPPVQSEITILPQSPYFEAQINTLKKDVQSESYYLLMGLLWGNQNLDKLHGLKIHKYLLIDKDLYDYRLSVKEEEKKIKIDPEQLEEVGLPFRKYPLFPELKIDYLIAMPTPFSFPATGDKVRFLKCVLKLISSVDPNDVIALKPHNAIEAYDVILNRNIFRVIDHPLVRPSHGLISFLCEKLLSCFQNCSSERSNRLKNTMNNILVAVYYRRLLKRVVLLKSLTPFFNFSLEIFLPHVRKGLITGRSNSIWHALFAKVPVYNCIDKKTAYVDKKNMIYYSMKYFEVPYCGGELKFNPEHFRIIREEIRDREIIIFLDEELKCRRKKELKSVP